MLTVVIDTNVLMVALSSRSNLHWLYQALINGKFKLVINYEILLEYEEQIRYRYKDFAVIPFMLIMKEAPNVLLIEPHYKWQLITADKDDNKFSDTYIAAAADYLVTHDRHFDVLKQINFPAINVVNAFEFQTILNNDKIT